MLFLSRCGVEFPPRWMLVWLRDLLLMNSMLAVMLSFFQDYVIMALWFPSSLLSVLDHCLLGKVATMLWGHSSSPMVCPIWSYQQPHEWAWSWTLQPQVFLLFEYRMILALANTLIMTPGQTLNQKYPLGRSQIFDPQKLLHICYFRPSGFGISCYSALGN